MRLESGVVPSMRVILSSCRTPHTLTIRFTELKNEMKHRDIHLKPMSQKNRLAMGGGNTANPDGPPFFLISCTQTDIIMRQVE
jgi:hypothetical protein